MRTKKIGRNDPCPCGSGKKYKKCCDGKLPRKDEILIGHKEKFEKIYYDHTDKNIYIIKDGKKITPDVCISRTIREKKNGRSKVLNQIPDRSILDNKDSFLFLKFDRTFVIDTNTKEIGKDRISVGCVIESYVEKTKEIQKINLKYRIHGYIFFKNCPNNQAEKYSWFKLINIIASTQKPQIDAKFAIITDHDLSNHLKYNKKELPIFDTFYLPNNFNLVFATSDSGSSNIINMLIKKCDKNANEVLKNLKINGMANINGKNITLDKILAIKEA